MNAVQAQAMHNLLLSLKNSQSISFDTSFDEEELVLAMNTYNSESAQRMTRTWAYVHRISVIPDVGSRPSRKIILPDEIIQDFRRPWITCKQLVESLTNPSGLFGRMNYTTRGKASKPISSLPSPPDRPLRRNY